MTTISEDSYQQLLAKYLETKGPNPARSFFGAWAWHAAREAEFQQKLRNEGVTVARGPRQPR